MFDEREKQHLQQHSHNVHCICSKATSTPCLRLPWCCAFSGGSQDHTSQSSPRNPPSVYIISRHSVRIIPSVSKARPGDDNNSAIPHNHSSSVCNTAVLFSQFPSTNNPAKLPVLRAIADILFLPGCNSAGNPRGLQCRFWGGERTLQ